MKRFFILALLLQRLLLFAGHEEDLVEEKLEIVLSELERDSYDQWDLPPFLENIFEFFGTIGILFRILFFLFLAAVLIFALYKLMGVFLKEQRIADSRAPIGPREKKDMAVFSEKRFPDKARTAFEAGDYSLAILLLHKGTVSFLYEKGVLGKGRDYTNREILTLIGKAEFSDAFYRIALSAEMILFNGKEGSPSDFLLFEEMYRSHFL